MNLLICGKQCGLCKQLADRLSREKHEVYFISGNKTREKLSDTVFQEYYFPYISEYINQIIVSAKPETIIVAGAHDRNYAWLNPEKDATEFVAGMTSLFMAAQNEGVRRLIYLSSTEVFENNTEDFINSQVKPNAESIRLKALLRTEKLLGEFQRTEDAEHRMEVIILRLPPVFGDYHDNRAMDYCLRSALSYIHDGKIPTLPEVQHTGIYFRDACEAVIRCLQLGPKEDVRLFQIRGLAFTESEFSQALIATAWHKGAVIDTKSDDVPLNPRTGYPPARIDSEDELKLRFHMRYELQSACDQLCKACLKVRKQEQSGPKNTIQIVPIIESVLAAILTYFLSAWLAGTWVGDGLDLFTIYVLLFGVAYGTSHGLFAAILAAIGTILLMMNDASFVDVISNYVVYLQLWQMVTVGVITGYVRDRFNRNRKGMNEENTYLSAELHDITLINDNNVYVKNVYEKRLVGYTNSLSHIYELTTQIDFMESQKVVFQAVHMVSELMGIKHVAIYTASQRSKFMRLSAASSELAASCGKSIKFDEESYLYESLSNKTIFMNRDFLPDRPTFAGAVYADAMLLDIVFVWTDDLRMVNLYESDMLAIACLLIEKSMTRAFLYEKSLRNDTYEGGLNIMRQGAFLEMLSVYEDGYQQGLLTYIVLDIDLRGHEQKDAAAMVRDTDHVGLVEGRMLVLLSNTSADDSAIVIRRYESKGMGATLINAHEFVKIMEEKAKIHALSEARSREIADAKAKASMLDAPDSARPAGAGETSISGEKKA